MRSQCIVGIFLFLAVEQSQSAIQASCPTLTRPSEWFQFWKNRPSYDIKICWPDVDEVDDEDFTISPGTDRTISGFNLRDSKNIKFLPTNLARTFPDLIAIQVLRCSITSINRNNFKGLSKLRSLELIGNNFENIASYSFIDLVSVEFLNLDGNNIRSVEENTFASLKALKLLGLNRNEIQFLHPQIFSSLVNLEIVSLASNKLEKIPKDLFKNNLKLTGIYLENNKIKFIDATVLYCLSNLNRVNLKGNVCMNETYGASSMDSMREKAITNCSENPNQRSLETEVVYLRILLNQKSREVEYLKRKIDFAIEENNSQKYMRLKEIYESIKEKQRQLETELSENLEVLRERDDGVNELPQCISETFDD